MKLGYCGLALLPASVVASGFLAGCNWFGDSPVEQDTGEDREEVLDDMMPNDSPVEQDTGEDREEVPDDMMPNDSPVEQDAGEDGEDILEDQWTPVDKDLGIECSSARECRSGFCVDGVCCDTSPGNCGGDCEACNLSGIRGYCTTRSEGDNIEVMEPCYYCNGSSDTSVPVSNNTQVAGCDGFCQACQDGVCSHADRGTDPGNHCSDGTTAETGCSGTVCDGYGGCLVTRSGDGGCPVCGTCSDDDIACEYYSSEVRDSEGCEKCHACNGLEIGTCSLSVNDCDDCYGCISTDNCDCYCQRGVCYKCEWEMVGAVGMEYDLAGNHVYCTKENNGNRGYARAHNPGCDGYVYSEQVYSGTSMWNYLWQCTCHEF